MDNHQSNDIIIITLIILFFIGIIIINKIDKIFIKTDYSMLIKLVLIGILLNLCIFVYLSTSFKVIKIQRGIRGPKGNRGMRGYNGNTKGCGVCSPEPDTIGYKRTENDKKNIINIQKPVIIN